MSNGPTNDHYRQGLPQRLRGEWATLTMNEEADTWALRREAADEIEKQRDTIAQHGARVTELLMANNREVERRRAAEAALRAP